MTAYFVAHNTIAINLGKITERRYSVAYVATILLGQKARLALAFHENNPQHTASWKTVEVRCPDAYVKLKIKRSVVIFDFAIVIIVMIV